VPAASVERPRQNTGPRAGAEESTMSNQWNWALLLIGALMTLVEVALGGFAGFDLVLIGSAFMIGGALGLWLQNATVGMLVSGGLCLLYIVIGRRWMRARVRVQGGVRSNVDAVLGQRGLVMQRVAEHQPGQVKIKDEIWRAVPASDATGPFEPGAVVTVVSVDGITLQVR
jgi:membrane protein implicated in regulation of membrane protease activity